MKRLLICAIILGLALALGCDSGKKKKKNVKQEEEKKVAVLLDTCPIARVEVLPDKVTDQKVYIGSGAKLDFSARALDKNGKEMTANFKWSFIYPDGDDQLKSGQGHRIEVTGHNTASMLVAGTSPGKFEVAAAVEDCKVGTTEHNRPAYGSALVEVGQKPGASGACGALRLKMGLRDVMGSTVLSSDKANMVAEISALRKEHNQLRVQFVINGRKNSVKRPLYHDEYAPIAQGMDEGYKTNLAIYPKRGVNKVYYELRSGNDLICTSQMEEFKAK